MDSFARDLAILGSLLLLALLADAVGRRTAVPRVTAIIALGIIIGPWIRSESPEILSTWLPGIAHVALVMVGFLLGGRLTRAMLREHGREVFLISAAVVGATLAVIALGLTLLGVGLATALLLAGIGTSTDPAATADVVRESRAKGPFTSTLLSIVAVDDAWGLVSFALMLAVAQGLDGDGSFIVPALAALREVGGAVLLGVVLGAPAAYATGRILPGEPTLIEALGVVFLCSGIGLWLEVSTLLAAMVMGATIANLARHHRRPFHEIELIEWPFMILFFVFAGASLDVSALITLGPAGLAYMALRVLGRILGGGLGGWATASGWAAGRRMGTALLPQAGIALGMALVAAQHIPEAGAIVVPVVVASTVIFELAGPVFTRRALVNAGEVG